MPDQLTGIKVFCRVSQLASFSAASRELGMSQAMASKHIQALEDRLGTRLLDRTPRSVALTAAGRTYLDACLEVLRAIDNAELAVARSGALVLNGEIRIHTHIFFGAEYVMPSIFRFRQVFPSISIDVEASDRSVNLEKEGFDLSFAIGGPSDGLDTIDLASSERVIAAAPLYLAGRGMPAAVDDLMKHDCIVVAHAQQGRSNAWRFGERDEVAVSVNCPLRVSNELAALHAGLAGMGLVYLPRIFIQSTIAAGRLAEIRLPGPRASPVRVSVARSSGQPVRESAKALLAIVADRLATHAPDYHPVPDHRNPVRAEDSMVRRLEVSGVVGGPVAHPSGADASIARTS